MSSKPSIPEIHYYDVVAHFVNGDRFAIKTLATSRLAAIKTCIPQFPASTRGDIMAITASRCWEIAPSERYCEPQN